MATKTLHPADVWTRERIARAVSYTAVFVRSPLNGGNIVRRAHSLAQAFAIADELNAAHGRFGRMHADTLNRLCRFFDVQPGQLMQWVPDPR